MYAEGGVNKHAIVTYKNINKIFIIMVLIIYFLLNKVILFSLRYEVITKVYFVMK